MVSEDEKGEISIALLKLAKECIKGHSDSCSLTFAFEGSPLIVTAHIQFEFEKENTDGDKQSN